LKPQTPTATPTRLQAAAAPRTGLGAATPSRACRASAARRESTLARRPEVHAGHVRGRGAARLRLAQQRVRRRQRARRRRVGPRARQVQAQRAQVVVERVQPVAARVACGRPAGRASGRRAAWRRSRSSVCRRQPPAAAAQRRGSHWPAALPSREGTLAAAACARRMHRRYVPRNGPTVTVGPVGSRM